VISPRLADAPDWAGVDPYEGPQPSLGPRGGRGVYGPADSVTQPFWPYGDGLADGRHRRWDSLGMPPLSAPRRATAWGRHLL